MRIVCPSCASQYEVSEEAIPEAGRDVQCAKCSEIWFQDRPMQLGEEDALLTLETPQVEHPEPQTSAHSETDQPDVTTSQSDPISEPASVFKSQRADRSAPVTAPPETSEQFRERPRPTIDPEVQRILREEAAFAQSVESDPTSVAASTPTSETISDALADAIEQQETSDQNAVEAEFNQTTEYVQSPPNDASSLNSDEVAPQIDAEGLSRVMHELDDANQRTQSTPIKEGVTIASARSLREILEAEAIDPVDVTDGLYNRPPENEVISDAIDENSEALSDAATSHIDAPEQSLDKIAQDKTIHFDEPEINASLTAETNDSFLGDLGKRPVHIQHSDSIEPELDLNEDASEPNEQTVEANPARPLIRPASDFIKSASSLIKRAEKTEPTISDDQESESEHEDDVAKDTSDISLAATTQNTAGRAVFTDIDELNSSLDIDTDDEQDEETDVIDLDIDELNEPTNKFSMGFLAACGIAVITTLMYMFAPTIGEKIPATKQFMSDYEASVHNGRMVLQDMYYQGGEPGFNTLLQNAKTKFMN